MIKKLFNTTFIRFILVGCINTLFGAAIMFIFYNYFHLSYWLSSASNYFFGSILSYFLNKHYTFRLKTRNPRIIGRFIINIVACYLVAYGVAKPFVRHLLNGSAASIQENVAMLVGMGLFTLLNYFGQKHFAFKRNS